MTDSDAPAKAAAERGFAPLGTTGPFTDLVGPMFQREMDDGALRLGLLVERRHLNAGGIVHGGLLMSLADNALGRHVYYALGGQTPMVTLSLNTDFVAAAREGDWLEGRAHIVRTTRSVVFVEGAVMRGEQTVLNAKGIWKILAKRDR